jgi:hypothetical protein
MKRPVIPAALLSVALAAAAWADDQVGYLEPGTRKEADVRGKIDTEGPAGIRIKTKAGIKDVPSTEIRWVVYDSKKVAALEFRQPLGKQARAVQPDTRPAVRKELLAAALQGYQELDAQVKEEPGAHRFLRFKIAEVMALQGRDDPARMDAAVAALNAYKTEFRTGWEIVPCLKLLAQILEEKGDVEGASAAYADLASVPDLPREIKQESEVLGVRLLLRAGKPADAEAKLKALKSSLAPDDPQRALVDVCLVQSQMAQGRLAQAEADLQAVLRGTTEANVRALAHNLLGDYYRLKKEPENAFWHYLRVDVLYNQDREEHAKALYYLSTLFDQVKNDPVRGEECRARLKGPEFAGTLYQRQAGEEKK